MRGKIILTLFGVCLLSGVWVTDASAQRLRLGVDGALNIPLGDWRDVSSTGLGVLAFIGLQMPMFEITGRAGYIYGIETRREGNDFSIDHIPILVGLKWYPNQFLGGYLAAEAGVVNNRGSVADELLTGDADGGSQSDWDMAATIGAGYQNGPIDARVQAFFPELDAMDDMVGLLLTLGIHL